MTTDEKNTQTFIQLVGMFQFMAMQHMGKIKNPATDSIERNLEGARFAIDVLDTLQARTRGNLSPDEDHFLRHALQELKLNYVDEARKGDSPASPTDQGTPS